MPDGNHVLIREFVSGEEIATVKRVMTETMIHNVTSVHVYLLFIFELGAARSRRLNTSIHTRGSAGRRKKRDSVPDGRFSRLFSPTRTSCCATETRQLSDASSDVWKN